MRRVQLQIAAVTCLLTLAACWTAFASPEAVHNAWARNSLRAVPMAHASAASFSKSQREARDLSAAISAPSLAHPVAFQGFAMAPAAHRESGAALHPFSARPPPRA